MDLHAIQGQRPATILQSMMHYKVQRYLSLTNLPVNINLLELKYYLYFTVQSREAGRHNSLLA